MKWAGSNSGDGIISGHSNTEPVGNLGARFAASQMPTPPETPLVITLVDGSTISIRFGEYRGVSSGDTYLSGVGISWTDPDGNNVPPPLVSKIRHGGNGIAWVAQP